MYHIFRFKYLGAIFSANGDQKYDIKLRITLVMTRMGQRTPPLKMRVYKTAICSLFTYGSEAWAMNEQAKAMLNGANARCLSRFTGKDAHQEASARSTRSYDLVTCCGANRNLEWGVCENLRNDCMPLLIAVAPSRLCDLHQLCTWHTRWCAREKIDLHYPIPDHAGPSPPALPPQEFESMQM